ncbi:Phytochrome-like protein cph2 [Bremerella volcania]|uniref:diguanylate cyclase n=2 Tax=Bremerella volcania TaxID=2527984 RepID=A0A518C5E7_9BACT|nr:Phytochrome-like protein cph2 [Bremerella volcania]
MAELLTFVLGDVFGVVTLVVGILIGFWLGRLWAKYIQPHQMPAPPEGESTVYREQLAGMIQFTSHFTGDLSKHIELLENLEQKLAHPEGDQPVADDGPSAKAVELIAQITAANQKLKQRLESAEATLKTQSQELEDTLSEARTDALTQLLNRRAFDEERERRWALWQRKQQPFSLLILDIDHFKRVNDTYGHDAGDQVLREVAARLNSVMRKTDYLARIGGEELAILVPEADGTSVSTVAMKVLNVVRSLPVEYGQMSIEVTVSCGLMPVIHADGLETLTKGADAALYAAKAAGRNCGFLNDGESLIPIESQTSLPAQHGESPATSQPSSTKDESEPTARIQVSELDSAANELKNRLFLISQNIMP